MADREKVLKGLGCCIQQGVEDVYCRELDCPYKSDSDSCRLNCWIKLLMDAVSLLKAQEPHVITKDDFSRCDDFGYIPAVFEPIDMKNFLNWEWSLITQNALSRNDGRYWSGLPSDEQRKAVKWDDPD